MNVSFKLFIIHNIKVNTIFVYLNLNFYFSKCNHNYNKLFIIWNKLNNKKNSFKKNVIKKKIEFKNNSYILYSLPINIAYIIFIYLEFSGKKFSIKVIK